MLGLLAGAYISIGGLVVVMVAGGTLGFSMSHVETQSYFFNPTLAIYEQLNSTSTITSPNIGQAHPGLVKFISGAVFPVGIMLVVLNYLQEM